MSSGEPGAKREQLADSGEDTARFEKHRPAAGTKAPGSGRHATFLDTNVLLYCDDSTSPAKQQKALEIVTEQRRNGTGVVSLQVLQEYFVNVTRRFGLDPDLAKQKLEVYARFRVVEPSVADLFAAIDLHRLRSLSFWDASIVHCAKQSGCKVLLTEDMQHGQVIDGVRIVNPFVPGK